MFFFILLSPVSGLANDADMLREILPGDLSDHDNIEPLWSQYPLSHYGLDVYFEEPTGFFDWSGKINYTVSLQMFSLIADSILYIQQIIAMGTIVLFRYSFSLDLVDDMIDDLAEALSGISGISIDGLEATGLFPQFVVPVIVFIGIWALWSLVTKRAYLQVGGGLFNAVVMIVLAFAVITYSAPILRTVNDVSRETSGQMLILTSKVTAPEAVTYSDAIIYNANQMFKIMVRDPWLILQFGTTNVSEERIHAILQHQMVSTDRNDAVKIEVEEYGNVMMQTGREGIGVGGKRLGFAFLSLMSTIGMAVIYASAALGLIISQLLVIIVVVALAFVLIYALMPFFGRVVIERWVGRLIEVFTIRIGLAFLVALALFVADLIYRRIDDYGWLAVSLLQPLLIVAVFIYRHKLVDLFTAAPRQNMGKVTGSFERAEPIPLAQKAHLAQTYLQSRILKKSRMASLSEPQKNTQPKSAPGTKSQHVGQNRQQSASTTKNNSSHSPRQTAEPREHNQLTPSNVTNNKSWSPKDPAGPNTSGDNVIRLNRTDYYYSDEEERAVMPSGGSSQSRQIAAPHDPSPGSPPPSPPPGPRTGGNNYTPSPSAQSVKINSAPESGVKLNNQKKQLSGNAVSPPGTKHKPKMISLYDSQNQRQHTQKQSANQSDYKVSNAQQMGKKEIEGQTQGRNPKPLKKASTFKNDYKQKSPVKKIPVAADNNVPLPVKKVSSVNIKPPEVD